MSPSRSFLSLAAVAFLLISAVSVPLAAADSPEEPRARPLVSESVDRTQPLQFETQQNNTSVSHKDPDAVNEDGNLGDLESYLKRHLSERLGRSATKISQGQYQQAQSVVGDEYNSLLEKYVDVAGETESTQTVEQFRKAQNQQQSLAQTVSEYRETYRAYQRAKQNGNQTRARELARKLERLSERTANQSAELEETYTNIENTTSISLNESQTAVEQVRSNVTNRQMAVRGAEFDPTLLELERQDVRTVSFTDPLLIRGRLTSRNTSPLEQRMIQVRAGNRTYLTDPLQLRGNATVPRESPVANQSIRVTVGNRSYEVSTGPEGMFSLQYRPVGISPGEHQLRVSYVPTDTSPYLGSAATYQANVTQTNATIRITQSNSTVAYGDTLQIRGQATVHNHSVPGLPVTITLAGRALGVATTSDNGEFVLSTPVPAQVPAGEQALVVRPAYRNRAVTGSHTRRTLSIRPTETTLTVNTSVQNADTVLVSGQLRTKHGTPIRNESVSIRVAGTTRATVQTNEQGRYQETIVRRWGKDTSGDSASTTVTATYAGSGSLGNATASATLPHKERMASTSARAALRSVTRVITGSPLWAGGVLLVISVSAILARRRFRTGESGQTPSDTDSISPTHDPSSPDGQSLISTAQDQLASNDPDAAVEAAYAAVRQYLAETWNLEQAGTHWEFYRACRDAGLDSVNALRQLTQAYERAAYGRNRLSEEDARTTLEVAVSLVQHTEDDGHGANAD